MRYELGINIRRVFNGVLFCCLFVVADNSIADDVDIYGTSGGSGISPNIMLMLGTSDSMSCEVALPPVSGVIPIDTCAYTGHGKQKITQMQSALRNVISGLNGGLSVGMSRFTHPGGSILYPVSMLSRDVGDGTASFEYSSVYPVIHPHDDAWLHIPRSEFILDDASVARDGSGRAQDPVIAWSDEPYVDIANPDVILGLRIDKIRIPRGASITEAYLVFHGAKQSDVPSDNVDNSSVGAASVTISVLKDATPRFMGSSQALLQPATSDIYQLPTVSLDQFSYGDFHSIDVTSLVQQKVTPLASEPEWCPGSAMTFLVSGVAGNTGSRHIHTNELAISAAPRLVVKYTKGNVSGVNTCTADPNLNFPNEPVTSVRNKLLELVELLPSNGKAAIAGTLLEVGNYFRGGAVEYGAGIGDDGDPLGQLGLFHGPRLGYMQTSQLSHSDGFDSVASLSDLACAYTTTRSRACVQSRFDTLPYESEFSSSLSYRAPAVSTNTNCATQNHLIFVGDGFPDSNNFISPLGASRNLSALYNGFSSSVGGCDTLDTWDCTKKIADEIKAPTGTDESVRVHVIGFDIDNRYSATDIQELENLASGTSDYYSANDGTSLVESLADILRNIDQAAATISIPSIAVNQVSGLQHFNQLYYSMYRPSDRADWLGNLKRFDLDSVIGEAVGINGEKAIINERVATVDLNNITTTRLVTRFNPDATSWWTSTLDAPDGGDVELGGLAGRLGAPSGTDRVYSLFGGYDAEPGWVNYPIQSPELSDSVHALDNTNVNNIPLPIGVPIDGAEIIIEWARLNQNMGSPIHSQGQLVTYSWDDGTNNVGIVDQDELYNSIFVSTNRGFFHGFDVSRAAPGARELFRFIPFELLENLASFSSNDPAPTGEPLIYGLDSTWTVFRFDAWKECSPGIFCKDDTITADPNPSYPNSDFVFTYGGMRRGGNNYYSLDVSSVNGQLDAADIKPKFQFAILGGAQNPPIANYPYENMGQTWSQPELGQINVGGIRTPVIIFAGGYDDKYDDADQVDNNVVDKGSAVYIVDAMTGKLLWWTSSSTWNTGVYPTGYRRQADMKFSIPSNVKVLDLNSDGLTDRLYVADLAGQIFRIDLDNAEEPQLDTMTSSPSFGEVTVMAKLGRTGTISSNRNRRFFDPPSVSFSACGKVNVAIVSGDRPRPFTSGTDEHLFVIHDSLGLSPQNIVVGDLETVVLAADGTTSGAVAYHDVGWKMELTADRERSYGSPFVFNSNLYFTSYIPPETAPATGACVVDTGVSRLYALSLACSSIGSGTNLFSNNNNQLTAYQEVMQGPAATPAVVMTQDANGNTRFTLLPSSEAIDPPTEMMKKTSWRSLAAP